MLINLIIFSKLSTLSICVNQILKTRRNNQAERSTQSIKTLSVSCVMYKPNNVNTTFCPCLFTATFLRPVLTVCFLINIQRVKSVSGWRCDINNKTARDKGTVCESTAVTKLAALFIISLMF